MLFFVNFIVTLDGFTNKEPYFFNFKSQGLVLQYQRDFHYVKDVLREFIATLDVFILTIFFDKNPSSVAR